MFSACHRLVLLLLVLCACSVKGYRTCTTFLCNAKDGQKACLSGSSEGIVAVNKDHVIEQRRPESYGASSTDDLRETIARIIDAYRHAPRSPKGEILNDAAAQHVLGVLRGAATVDDEGINLLAATLIYAKEKRAKLCMQKIAYTLKATSMERVLSKFLRANDAHTIERLPFICIGREQLAAHVRACGTLNNALYALLRKVSTSDCAREYASMLKSRGHTAIAMLLRVLRSSYLEGDKTELSPCMASADLESALKILGLAWAQRNILFDRAALQYHFVKNREAAVKLMIAAARQMQLSQCLSYVSACLRCFDSAVAMEPEVIGHFGKHWMLAVLYYMRRTNICTDDCPAMMECLVHGRGATWESAVVRARILGRESWAEAMREEHCPNVRLNRSFHVVWRW